MASGSITAVHLPHLGRIQVGPGAGLSQEPAGHWSGIPGTIGARFAFFDKVPISPSILISTFSHLYRRYGASPSGLNLWAQQGTIMICTIGAHVSRAELSRKPAGAI